MRWAKSFFRYMAVAERATGYVAAAAGDPDPERKARRLKRATELEQAAHQKCVELLLRDPEARAFAAAAGLPLTRLFASAGGATVASLSPSRH